MKLSAARIIPFAIALLVAVIFMAPSLFQGDIPAQTDWLYDYGPWNGLEPPQAYNKTGGDSFFVYLPDRIYAMDEWKAGRLPLWNPYQTGGMPVMGTQTANPLDPLLLLMFLFPPGLALGITYALLMLVAGWGMVLFLRRRGLRDPVALALGGAVFAANPYFIYWLELRVFLAGLATLPLALWALDTILLTPKMRRAVAVLGLTVGYAVVAGTLQTLAMFVGVLCLRALWVFGEARAAAGRPWLVLVGLIAGLALGAVPLAASLELLEHSTRMSAASSYYAEGNHLHWRALALWFNPEVYGGILTKDFTAFDICRRTMAGGSGWGAMGIIPLWLAGFSLFRREVPRRERRFWGLLTGGALLFLMGIQGPLYDALAGVWPAVHNVDLLRGLFVINLGGAILAAWGSQALLEAWRMGSGGWRWGWVALLAFGALMIILGQAGLRTPHGLLRDLAPVLIIGAAVMVVGDLGGRLGLRPSWRLWILLAITLLELGRAHHRYNTFSPLSTYYSAGPPMKILREQTGPPDYSRFMAGGGTKAFPPNTSSLFGLTDVRGYTNLPIARFRFLLECAERKVNLGNQPHAKRVTSPIYRLLGVNALITSFRMADEAFPTPLMTGANTREDGLARAFLVHEAEIVPGPGIMRELLSRPEFNPAKLVYLEEARGPLPSLSPPPGPETVRIRKLEPQQVQIDVNATAPGILVLSDAFYPGWQARVDGRAAPILPVNWGLRGVAVPAGAYEVEFLYRPAWLWPAGILSLLALLGLSITLVRSLFDRRPDQ